METKMLTRQLKALANERRLLILRELKKRAPLSVGDVAHAIRLSLKATSKHLTILTAASMVESQKKGLSVFYRLSPRQKPPLSHVLTLF